MRSKLLLSTAALLAGVALASAQNMPAGQSGGAAGASQSGGAAGAGPSGAGQERQSPSTQGQRGQDKPGQMQGEKEQTTQGKDRDMDKSQRGQRDQKEKTTQGKDRDMDKSQRGQREDRDKDKAQRGQRDQTTGQREGQREQGQRDGQRDRDQSPKQGQKDQDRRDQQGQAKQDRDGGKTTLSSEQRTKIRTTVLNRGPRVSNVNFSVSVGTVVPTSVRVVAVPDVLIDIHPEWRGFMYFIVGDQIIIVDRSHRIVAILEV
jgi:hypothetical protein